MCIVIEWIKEQTMSISRYKLFYLLSNMFEYQVLYHNLLLPIIVYDVCVQGGVQYSPVLCFNEPICAPFIFLKQKCLERQRETKSSRIEMH